MNLDEPRPRSSSDPAALEYAETVKLLATALRGAHLIASSVDLEEMERQLQRAHDVGPIIDPTAYRDALGTRQLEMQAVLVRWCAQTIRACAELERLVAGGTLGRVARGPLGKNAPRGGGS